MYILIQVVISYKLQNFNNLSLIFLLLVIVICKKLLKFCIIETN